MTKWLKEVKGVSNQHYSVLLYITVVVNKFFKALYYNRY